MDLGMNGGGFGMDLGVNGGGFVMDFDQVCDNVAATNTALVTATNTPLSFVMGLTNTVYSAVKKLIAPTILEEHHALTAALSPKHLCATIATDLDAASQGPGSHKTKKDYLTAKLNTAHATTDRRCGEVLADLVKGGAETLQTEDAPGHGQSGDAGRILELDMMTTRLFIERSAYLGDAMKTNNQLFHELYPMTQCGSSKTKATAVPGSQVYQVFSARCLCRNMGSIYTHLSQLIESDSYGTSNYTPAGHNISVEHLTPLKSDLEALLYESRVAHLTGDLLTYVEFKAKTSTAAIDLVYNALYRHSASEQYGLSNIAFPVCDGALRCHSKCELANFSTIPLHQNLRLLVGNNCESCLLTELQAENRKMEMQVAAGKLERATSSAAFNPYTLQETFGASAPLSDTSTDTATTTIETSTCASSTPTTTDAGSSPTPPMTTQHNTLTTVVPESEPIGAVSLYAASALSAPRMVNNQYTAGRRPANLPEHIVAPTKGFGQCDVELSAYFMTVFEDKININPSFLTDPTHTLFISKHHSIRPAFDVLLLRNLQQLANTAHIANDQQVIYNAIRHTPNNAQHHIKFLSAMRGRKRSKRQTTPTWSKWIAYKQIRARDAAAAATAI
jgi:hypothetical protein